MAKTSAWLTLWPAISCGVLTFLITVAGWLWLLQILDLPGSHDEDVIVLIKSGSSHATIRQKLESKGIIQQPYHYDAARLFAGNDFIPKAGEFFFPRHASLREIMNILHIGQSVQRQVTFLEGQTTAEIIAKIRGMSDLTGEIEEIVNEGSLFPDTYFYTYATRQSELINRMQDRMDINLAEAWVKRKSQLPYKTPGEALIMASIIEKEAATKADRDLVSAVLINRLRLGMRLQSDPTVRYGIDFEHSLPISKADLKRKTPWNTYMKTGLPKTPICNPSAESIDSALNPADSDYLYFVSDGFGGLRFAKTLDIHNRNVRIFRRISSQSLEGAKP